jgi:hypothetical protein
VAEQVLTAHAVKLAHVKQARQFMEKAFVSRWKDWPIGDVSERDRAMEIREIVERPAPAQARNALGHLRRMYSWAIVSGDNQGVVLSKNSPSLHAKTGLHRIYDLQAYGDEKRDLLAKRETHNDSWMVRPAMLAEGVGVNGRTSWRGGGSAAGLALRK